MIGDWVLLLLRVAVRRICVYWMRVESLSPGFTDEVDMCAIILIGDEEGLGMVRVRKIMSKD
jgi:hypothetical protein